MNAADFKLLNITDMAFGFSSMTRVFQKNSDKQIITELNLKLPNIGTLKSQKAFEDFHDNFCLWFENNIKTNRGGKASYGQGAKVLDVALKVYVYYCHLPNQTAAYKIAEWLHAAVDNNMMEYLTGNPKLNTSSIKVKTIASVTKIIYPKLQALVLQDIKLNFSNSILPVQWDDVLWRVLNNSIILEGTVGVPNKPSQVREINIGVGCRKLPQNLYPVRNKIGTPVKVLCEAQKPCNTILYNYNNHACITDHSPGNKTNGLNVILSNIRKAQQGTKLNLEITGFYIRIS